VEATKQKEDKRNSPSPRNRKARHSVSTAILKSVAEIGTQSAMKSMRKTSLVLFIYPNSCMYDEVLLTTIAVLWIP
jgi:hypothetical protein